VLEHVNDTKALQEIHRILKPDSRLIAMVPICEGWDETYVASATPIASLVENK
jgi:SAM-dependent methyltransferase